jgi:hypothetical protein
MHQFIRSARNSRFRYVWLVAAVALAVVAERGAEAHKAVTSKYGYNDDIFPIFRERCGRCHVTGGPAPMSLMTYQEAVPWAESIREELTSEKMPPWYVDPAGPTMKGGLGITPKEIDMVITWASGGTPQGDFAKKPAPMVARAQWRAGEPALKFAMEAEHVLPPGKVEDAIEVTIPTNLAEAKWVKAADLLPGEPTMVRDAVISLENGPVLAMWVPGTDPVGTPSGAAFKVPAGAKIHLQIHYKKSWQDEQTAKSDRSTVGLYVTDPPSSGREVQSIAADGPPADSPEPRTFSGAALQGPARVIAIRPSFDFPYGSVNIQAVTPTGSKIPLLLLSGPRPEWRRRYWLAEPVELPSGSKLEVAVAPPAIESADPLPPKKFPLQIALDYVPQ